MIDVSTRFCCLFACLYVQLVMRVLVRHLLEWLDDLLIPMPIHVVVCRCRSILVNIVASDQTRCCCLLQ